MDALRALTDDTRADNSVRRDLRQFPIPEVFVANGGDSNTYQNA
jgi:hypothetical protein